MWPRPAEWRRRCAPPATTTVTFLIVILQNLGRLLLSYHLPDDALQMQHLMQAPEPAGTNPSPWA